MTSHETKVAYDQQYCDNQNFWVFRNALEKWEKDHPKETINLMTTYEYKASGHPLEKYVETDGTFPDHKILWLALWIRKTCRNQNLRGWYHYLEATRSWPYIRDTPVLDLLKNLNRLDLQLIAREINLTGYSSRMNKADLVEALANTI
jgi:hypothetical protein